MIGEPFGPWLYQREAEFFSAIRVTVEGYSGEETFDWLYDEAQTLRVMPSDEGKEGLSAVSQVRQRIESSFSELWRRFADRIYSRSWHGLWTNLLLKILEFNMERAGIIATA